MRKVSLAIALLLFCSPAFAKNVIPPVDLQKAAQAALIKDPVAATNAYLDAVPEKRRAMTKRYAHGNYLWDVVDFLYSTLIFIALLAFGISARMKAIALRLTRFRPLQTALY